jgi:tetratricopeptide (TPR) repeat protein
MRNLLPHGHRRDTPVLRMFRNHPAVRFSFPIHEDVSGAVQARLVAEGQGLRHLTGVVEHHGYVRERAASRNKKSRDTELLLACLERDRNDLYSWFKLLELARFWNDRPLWAEAAGSARRALEMAGPMALAGKPFGGELVVLCADGFYPGDPGAALRLIDSWADVCDPSAALFLRRGELRELSGEAIRAAADFARCRELAAVTPDHQLATVRPLMGLARLALSVGDTREAWRRVEQALAHGPRDPEALLLAVLLCRARGELVERDFAESHRAAHGDCVELHEALGEAALMSGRPAEAAAELRQAAGRPPSGRLALRLAQALLASGDVDGARGLCADLIPVLPEAALGVLVCDLLAGRDSELTLEIDDQTAHRELRSWADLLRGAGAPAALLEELRRAAPAVAEFFPWLPRYLAAGSPSPARAAR